MQSGLSSCWLCMYSCMYVCTCMYVHACMYPPFHHTYVRIYVSMYVCMYACMDAPYPSYLSHKLNVQLPNGKGKVDEDEKV